MREKAQPRIWLCITAFGAVLIAFSTVDPMPIRLIWNASPSVPTGLYWIRNAQPKIRDIVLVDLPVPFKTLADRRGYLPKNVPALKRVRAIEGDIVCRFGRMISINSFPASVAQVRDWHGLKLPEWDGCHTLKVDEVFLLSDHPKSFDGRYFGSISRDNIIGLAIPVWTD